MIQLYNRRYHGFECVTPRLSSFAFGDVPFPVPSPSNSSASSSSSRKRKRESSDAASSASSASDFSKTVKRQVIYTDNVTTCWHCGASPTDICYVIGKKDRSFPDLITFTHLSDADNATPLCPTCHRNFDDINRPDLFFIPFDLQYFIDFEKPTTHAASRAPTQRRRCISTIKYGQMQWVQMRMADIQAIYPV